MPLQNVVKGDVYVYTTPACHTLIPKEVIESFHTCAQDVEITRTTNSNSKIAQCHNYNIIRVYLL
jgi:hypothetical protein